MKINRRFICFLMTAVMIMALAGCGKGNDTAKPAESKDPAAQSTAQEAEASKDTKSGETSAEPAAEPAQSSTGKEAEPAAEPPRLTGKINLIELDDRDPSILRGVRIIGNRIGSGEDINGKESSLDDVRCVFALDEWIDFYPDIDAEYGLRVWIVDHRDDQEYYNTCKFSDLMPGFATYCDLHYPVDEENPDEYCWGSFYLFSEEHEAGYYDFVFTYEGKAIGTLLTRFYIEEELIDKSGDELEALMHE